MTPEGVERLQAHAHAIVRSARLRHETEIDIEEEIVGHLTERVDADVAGGIDEDVAVRTAIADFGDVVAIGGDLGRTYHSRLWAGTVGVLLAAREAPGPRPGAVGGLRLLLAITIVLTALSALVAIMELTPLHALLEAGACFGLIVSGSLAYRGLGIGRRWSLGFGLATAAVLVFEGVVPLVPPPPGTTMIPVLALLAAAILLWVGLSAREVRAFVAGSLSIGRPLVVALAVAVVFPTVIARALPAIPDPSQAGASDASLSLSMVCGRRDSVVDGPSGPIARNGQYAMVLADVVFRRTDVLPLGLAGQLNRSESADAAGFRIVDPRPIEIENGGQIPGWLLDDGVDVRVVETGDVAGWFGASSASVNLLPDTIGSFTVGIDPDRIAPNHTIRISWTIIPTRDGEQPWPRADVAYAHLKRFLIEGTIGCGEHASGAPVPGATPHPEGDGFLPGLT